MTKINLFLLTKF